MPSYLDLRTRIADDLARTDLSTQIQNEIKGAIQIHQTERFWFNETRTYTFNTVAGTSDYAIAAGTYADMIEIDAVQLAIGGTDIRNLRPVDPVEIDYLLARNDVSGQPYSYAYYAQQFRLYPKPDQVYAARIEGQFITPDLSLDADSNIWTNQGFELIRSQAKFLLFANVLKDTDQAQTAQSVMTIVLNRMRHETTKRWKVGNTIVATDF